MAGRIPAGAVDCHAHVIKKGIQLAHIRHSEPARNALVEDYLRTLDTHGIDYGLLTAPSFYGSNNEVLLDALGQASGRLRGTAIVEPDIAEDALSDLQGRGVCGLRLNWVKRDVLPEINSPDYKALFAKAKNLWKANIPPPFCMPTTQAAPAR